VITILDVVTFGETMVLMVPDEMGSLQYIYNYKKKIGGAESNFAIGLSRLGHKVGWFSKLGDDPHGRFIKAFIQGEGVDTSRVTFTGEAPTGIFFKERYAARESKIYYYRQGSAASTLSMDDVDEDYISQARFLHITGITPALSQTCLKTVMKTIDLAHEKGLRVSFDPNIRMKLWKTRRMKEVLIDIIAKADIVMPSVEEGELIFGTASPEKIAEDLLKLNTGIAVVKTGAAGCLVGTEEGMKRVQGFKVEQVVDPHGAGDGFAAGFISGLIDGLDAEQSAKRANAAGAFATGVMGDVEGLAYREELETYLSGKSAFYR